MRACEGAGLGFVHVCGTCTGTLAQPHRAPRSVTHQVNALVVHGQPAVVARVRLVDEPVDEPAQRQPTDAGTAARVTSCSAGSPLVDTAASRRTRAGTPH